MITKLTNYNYKGKVYEIDFLQGIETFVEDYKYYSTKTHNDEKYDIETFDKGYKVFRNEELICEYELIDKDLKDAKI